MRVLSIPQTITTTTGSYWWRDWEDKADGGTAPAKCNLPAYCYLHEGIVYSLNTSEQRGIAGGKVWWEVKPASKELVKKMREYFPEKF